MRKHITLTLGTLIAVCLVATAAALAQAAVIFERQQPWFVAVDGDLIGEYRSRGEAARAASAAKLDDPVADVYYLRHTIWRAALDGPPPEPTATPAPPTPTPAPPPEPTATPAPPTPTPTPTPTPPPGDGLVWGYDETRPSPDWSRPAMYEPYVDPAYGTTITRVTDADGTRFDRNTYSRRQPENSDGTMLLTYHGNAKYRVYERSTGELVRELALTPGDEPQWHPSDPGIIRHLSGGNSYYGALVLNETQVVTGQRTVVADFTDRLQQVLPGALYVKDRDEGSPSADGNRYAWMVYDDTETLIGLMTYDLASDTILGVLPADQLPDAGFLDAVSMSPTGRYAITQHWYGTYVFDADLTNQRLLYDGAEHSDIALDTDGGDVYVYIDFSAGPNGGWLMATDMDTLAETRIFDLYDGANTSIHISGKGYAKPGWVVASTYSCKVDFAWSCHKVMAVELAPNGRVLNLAHTYNCGDSYWTETHAAVNRDFTRVYYNSDSGSCGIDAEVFMIDLPHFS